ncbi:MAG TPA: FKBP-type peptidyl-prolyl cis-trans isomerase [Steroidobacteraceae bacterium]|nr:FKBP-type peptidyl-prolyl cis-trans isomerase [Steroidobacteraceae bacterium]
MPMRRTVSLLALGVLTGAVGCGFALAADEAPSPAHHAAAAGAATGAADSDSAVMHALGELLSRQLSNAVEPFQPSDRELRAVLAGLNDGIHHPESVKAAESFIPQLQALQQQRTQAQVQREEKSGAAYLSKAAAQPHARTTSSGLVFIPQQAGTGPSPKIGDTVRVEYTGRLTDGSVFDSSAQHGGAATFPLGKIIPCWNEALSLMKVGGRARVVCPAKLAYGDRGAGGVIKPGATLDFEVHLVAIEPTPPTPAAAAPRATPAVPVH